ncbi:MAG TPA: hypothetical protein VNX02_07165 [Steroidobacteraceae bacterium]|jgi:hypothetical protein|nr:hypothetical protein [Steroidobacteraceae bacterium]
MTGALRWGWLLAAAPLTASALEVAAGPPTDVAVTVYRAPSRPAGSLDLDNLAGFALITEKRLLSVPAGVTRVRFEGVADGIEAESAILTGLPETVIEKNRDAHVLSPAELVAAAVGGKVVLMRTDRKTGKVQRTLATIRSDADGVVFETAQGIEALRCSGLAETFTFSSVSELRATPTLSVLVRSDRALEVPVTLAYLARGFDWTANYVATLTPDGTSMDLGAWVTLANGNGIGFPGAQTQVVAGRLNRESGEVEPFNLGGPILARCWPQGTTSDIPPPVRLQMPMQYELAEARMFKAAATPAAMMGQVAVTAGRVEQEELGDLKLYRVPERTTVASRESKQVRLLDRERIPIAILYKATVTANRESAPHPAERLLRTRNDRAHGLALPLPSGQVATFVVRGSATLLIAQAPLHDTAVDEELEIGLGTSADVGVRSVPERTTVGPEQAAGELPLLPGISRLESAQVDQVNRVEISNARASPIRFELSVQLRDGMQLIGADHPAGSRNGRPLFELTIPAGGHETLRYQTEHSRIAAR